MESAFVLSPDLFQNFGKYVLGFSRNFIELRGSLQKFIDFDEIFQKCMRVLVHVRIVHLPSRNHKINLLEAFSFKMVTSCGASTTSYSEN